MRVLSFILICCLFMFLRQRASHPHGDDFKLGCGICHSPEGWHLDKTIYSFDHNTTKLPLTGQHTKTDCRLCHPTLVFKEAKTDCIDCHTDMHQATVGLDCARCHSTASWLVTNITEIHQVSRFPLLGAHRTADCTDCHLSESLARFDVIGVNCIDCHRQDYIATTRPNHAGAGFSEDCSVCHPVNSFQWTGAGFNHSFFTLTEGHSTPECADCHLTGNYSDANPDCFSCHQDDYTATTNPVHSTMGFPTTCNTCHTLAPGWTPASFKDHDSQSFPIYSGKHKGTWSSCNECHTNPSNYSQFTCLSCHEHNKASMDSEHDEESGYSYTSTACLNCHPTGVADDRR
jgi:hypothetical protein